MRVISTTMPPAFRLPALFLLLVLHGCATSSVFLPYPGQAQSWTASLRQGEPLAAAQRLEKKNRGRDSLLFLQEQARLQQLGGAFDTSRSTFQEVFDRYERNDAAARIRASGLAAGTGSLLTNDNALPYKADPYERIFSYAFQALNYLSLGDPDGAAVELRRAALAQRVAEQENERRIAKAEQEAADNKVDVSQYEGYFDGLNAAAAKVRSSINNAWTHYLSAVFWEGRGNYNDALVDYKQALSVAPDVEFLKADIARVSARLDGRWKADRGLVVVIHEQGLVPPKREVSVPVPTIHGYFSVAFPTYRPEDFQAPSALKVVAGDQVVATEVLVDVGATAARALKEEVPGMLARQTLRAATKYSAQKQANDNLGLFGALVTQVYNLVSERADLRSWLTLPAHGLATRLELPAGVHVLQLSGSGADASVAVPVRAGGVTLVRVVDTGSFLRTDIYPVQEEQ